MSDKESPYDARLRYEHLATNFLSRHCKDDASDGHSELVRILFQCWITGWEAGRGTQWGAAFQTKVK